MSDFIFELSYDPIPYESKDIVYKSFKESMEKLLKEHRIEYETCEVLLDSQHLVLLIKGISSAQYQKNEIIRGPQKSLATTRCGKKNSLYKKFVKQKQGNEGAITVKTEKNKQYFYVEKKLKCEKTEKVMPKIFKLLIEKVIVICKFPIIINNVYALYDEVRVEIGYNEGIESSSTLVNEPINSRQYIEKIKGLIENDSKMDRFNKHMAKAIGEGLTPYSNTCLERSLFFVDEIKVHVGTFKEQFLELPAEIVAESLRANHNVVLLKEDGKLTNTYAIIFEQEGASKQSASTTTDEVNAKIEKAYKLFKEDIEIDFAKNTEDLKNLVFIEDLGTMYDKVQRVKHISLTIVDLLEIGEPIATYTAKGAELCKNDLLSKMVSVYPNLHGTIGKNYSLIWGEEQEVSQGIQEYICPQKRGDDLPQTMVGSVLSIADKMDTIVGCFSAGYPPDGSDPFRIKNKTDAVIKIIYQCHMNISLKRMVNLSIALYESFHILKQKDKQALLLRIMTYFNRRFKLLLSNKGFDDGVIESILSTKNTNLTLNYKKADYLQSKLNSEDMELAKRLYSRINNILLNNKIEKIELEFLKDEAEKKLYENLSYCKTQYYDNIEKGELNQAFNQLLDLQQSIEKMFDQTYILTEDTAVKQNRLALLGAVKELFLDFCDFSKLG
ncbi:glycine--tRNA ligase subunit beta [Proteinivorax hydrogeniformans]|uniref:glycine--tRNA ligase n=1 Tax=Proteinivorax hydrogeniformans TaxID=1826727 RepID=A0AAU8HWS2_9FIRM